MRTFLLVPALAASACGSQYHPSPLARFQELSNLSILVKLARDGTGTLAVQALNGCYSTDAVATQDGQPMALLEVGSERLGYGYPCLSPTWALNAPVPEEPETRFTITDASAQLTMGVQSITGLHQFVPPPQPLSLQWGQTVSLEWTAPTDDLKWSILRFQLVAGTRRLWANQSAPVTQGSTVQLTLPAGPSDGGPRSLPDAVLELGSQPTLGLTDCSVPHPSAYDPGCGVAQFDTELVQGFPVTVQ